MDGGQDPIESGASLSALFPCAGLLVPQPASFSQRDECAFPDDDMVQNRDAHCGTGPGKLSCDRPVLNTGRRISRRVIVDQNHTSGTLDDGGPEHFPRMYQRCIEDAAGNQHTPDHPVLGVEEERMELFLGQIPEEGPDPGEDIAGSPNRLILSPRFHGRSTSQFHSRHNSGGGGRSNPRLGFQHTRREGSQTPKGAGRLMYRRVLGGTEAFRPTGGACPPKLAKEMVCYVQGRAEGTAAPYQNRQQLPNRKDSRPQGPQSLPGPISPVPGVNRGPFPRHFPRGLFFFGTIHVLHLGKKKTRAILKDGPRSGAERCQNWSITK